jgi:hypothetical protein
VDSISEVARPPWSVSQELDHGSARRIAEHGEEAIHLLTHQNSIITI